MKSIIKTTLFISAMLVANAASSKCLLDANNIISSLNNVDNTTEISTECNDKLTVKKGAKYRITLVNEPSLTSVDLSGLSHIQTPFVIRLENNINLEKMKIGRIKEIMVMNLSNTKLDNLRFLSGLENGTIYVKQKITKYPSKNSQFCQSVRTSKIKIVPFPNNLLSNEACKYN